MYIATSRMISDSDTLSVSSRSRSGVGNGMTITITTTTNAAGIASSPPASSRRMTVRAVLFAITYPARLVLSA